MVISIEEVDRIAKLAKLKFDIDTKLKLQQELSNILDYVGQLKEVAPAALEAEENLEGVNLMRDDFDEQTTPPQDLLVAAPDREGDFIKVQSILD